MQNLKSIRWKGGWKATREGNFARLCRIFLLSTFSQIFWVNYCEMTILNTWSEAGAEMGHQFDDGLTPDEVKIGKGVAKEQLITLVRYVQNLKSIRQKGGWKATWEGNFARPSAEFFCYWHFLKFFPNSSKTIFRKFVFKFIQNNYICSQEWAQNLQVRPHYATRHTAAKCGKATRQKLRHATSIGGRCVGLAAACHSTLRSLKIRSVNCRSHQKKPRGIWWVKGFKMVSANLRKKSDQVRRSLSTILVTWRRSAKNSFFMWTRSHWQHMLSNFCYAAKLQCVAFCRAA